jgi:phytoene dehydrogenase-like protein
VGCHKSARRVVGWGDEEDAHVDRSDEIRDVVVIGGGLAGRVAAATAADAGASVLLADGHPGANRAGTDHVGRFRFNRGAHALYRGGEGRAVLRRLGVRVAGAGPPLAGALGRRGDLVDRLPYGPKSLARTRLLSGRERARFARELAELPRLRPARLADRTVAEWFDDRGLDGGPRALFEQLARTTTYVADLDRLSADVVARYFRLVGRGVVYIHGGWETLVEGLGAAGARRGVERVVAPVRSAVPDGGRVRVTLAAHNAEAGGEADVSAVPDGDGAEPNGGGAARDAGGERVVLASAVVVAAGTPEACASVLPANPPAWERVGPPVQVACLDLGLAEPPRTRVLLGVDRPLYLICHSPPAQLAPGGAAVVHAVRYRRVDETSSVDARAELEEHCRVAGIEPDAAEEVRYLHRMVACGAMPTPASGGLAARPGVADTGLDGVFVAGDWVGAGGHLADAALTSGESAGRQAARHAANAGRATVAGATLGAHG